ncbi:precorrin-6y C5,15-methyltransferase (decarboxylating) subunit CbiE [Alkaliphilus oremlandii]|uniref:Precorrin-6y C5,15-methyltransferase (Decarboxylating), CbiE subunit n=1 Tax=Alkaliphilus oremlandii (strain OhILAs) TaxID=350688 RepID=A8MG26_ALKOO|nr:precorrin-6y C5,15-methyltransferase (decarboxylating) subunit CbiE [Alkaliphilus oremlandii]ABW18564.1 precorrin-6y C5,15-methyltransferase (decarboxylating), CbiE subunit [Alkaliphilus oremlandii OhILAs]
MTVAGIGPGNPKYLTLEVKEAIEKAQCVLAFGRVSSSLKSIRTDFIEVSRVDEIVGYAHQYEDLLLLASGDPNFYGIVEFLKRKEVAIDGVLPGISSFQYMMSRLEKSWQGAQFLSLHGREESLDTIGDHGLIILLTDKDNRPSLISKKLGQLGKKGRMYVGFNLSYEDEKIIKANIGEEIEDVSNLSVVVIENEMD